MTSTRLIILALLMFLLVACTGGFPLVVAAPSGASEIVSRVSREASDLNEPSQTLKESSPTPVRPPPTLIPAMAFNTPIPDLPPTPTPTLIPTIPPYPTPTPVSLGIPLPANYGPSYYPQDVNPLTGLVVSEFGLLERRPMAIKITNYPRRVRPQSGLNLADLVFEYYIERGLTRFISVFYGNEVPRIGPVRSGRFFDEHIVRMYNAIFVFASADRRVLDTWLESDLVNRLVIERPGNCPPMCRDKSNPDYNNLYTSTAMLGPYVVGRGSDNIRPDLKGMRFQTIIPWGGVLGVDIFTRYSNLDYNVWRYNAGSGKYERYQETREDSGQGESYAPLNDELTDQPVSADNVVVLFVPHEDYIDTETTEIIKIKLIGSGNAFVFRNGRAYEAVWSRTAEDAPLSIARPTGGTFPLKPGRTFFQVIGVSSQWTQTTSVWRFTHEMP